MLKGNLTSFSLGEVFQSLAVNNHTGTLKILQKDGAQKCVYFSHGEISLFSSGSPEALRIGEILIRQGKIAPADLKAALNDQKETGELLGKILMRRSLIGKDDLRLALEFKIREEIYDLFLLTDAEFEFYINHLPDEIFDPVLKNTRIAINTSSVVLEGIRRVDEWKLIQRRIRTFDEIFVPAEGAAEAEADQDPSIRDLLEKLDGKTPVLTLFEAFGGSRFECAKTLYELVESGTIRPLCLDEALASGRKALSGKDPGKALGFLRFADQMDPAHPEVLRTLAGCHLALEQTKEAGEVCLRALRLYSKLGMHQEALEIGRPLIVPGIPPDLETAELVFRAAIQVGDRDAIISAGDLTARLALEGQDLSKVEGVLEELWGRGIKDLNFRLELAEVFSRSGEKDRAIRHLDSVAEELLAEKRLKDLIKVLRLIFEIDPRRQDVKHRLQNLLIQQEQIEKSKKRKITVAGGAVIAILILGTIPLFYELKARELYCHAQRLEEISLVSNDFTKVKDAYEQLLRTYCFSSQANTARISLDRISTFERVRREAIDREKSAIEKEQTSKLQKLRDALPTLLKEAKAHEEAGRIEEAHAVYTQISAEFYELPGARSVLFPIRITSNPPGASLDVNGTPSGKTPLVLHATKGQELLLSLSRTGCQSTQEKIIGGSSWKHHISMDRRPIGEMRLSGSIQQPLVAADGRLFFPARDGFLYAISMEKKEVAWQRRVGQFGDLVSEMGTTSGEMILGTVGGELQVISRDNGKSRWRARFNGAVVATPVVSPDLRWVAAASVEGETAIFEFATGELKGAFRAEDEVTAAPAFLGDILLVGSADHRLYELTVPAATPRRAIDFPGPIITDIVAQDHSAIFGTGSPDAAIHRYGTEEGRVLWSCLLDAAPSGPPVATASQIFVGTTAGQVVAIDSGKGSVIWKRNVSKGHAGRLLLVGSHVILGTESGDIISLAAPSGEREWGYRADSAIFAPPLLVAGRLYVASTSGKILVLEHIE